MAARDERVPGLAHWTACEDFHESEDNINDDVRYDEEDYSPVEYRWILCRQENLDVLSKNRELHEADDETVYNRPCVVPLEEQMAC